MEVKDEFQSIKNKGLLWDLLCEENVNFKNALSSNFKETQQIFENTIMDVISQKQKQDNLLDLNKRSISTISKQFVSKKVNPNEKILSTNIQQSRMNELDKKFKQTQEEMNNMLNVKKPDNINFSSDIDTPLLNVEEELNKKIAERKYDIMNVIEDSNTDNTDNKDNTDNTDTTDNKEENIQQGIKFNNNIIKNELNDTVTELENDIFSKLKTKTMDSDDDNDFVSNNSQKILPIINKDNTKHNTKHNTKYNNDVLLNKILDNQNLIMKHLNIL